MLGFKPAQPTVLSLTAMSFESDFQWSICNISELSMDPMRTRLPVEAWEQYRVFNIHIVRSMKQFIYFMIKGLPNSRIPRPVAITLKQITDLQYTQMEVIFWLICSFLPTGNPRPDTRLPLDPTEQCTLLEISAQLGP